MSDNMQKQQKNDLQTYQIKLDSLTTARLKESAAIAGQEFSAHCREVLRSHINALTPNIGEDGETARVGLAVTRIYRAITTLSELDPPEQRLTPLYRLVIALQRLVHENNTAAGDLRPASIDALFVLANINQQQVETVAAVAEAFANREEVPRRRGRPRKLNALLGPAAYDVA